MRNFQNMELKVCDKNLDVEIVGTDLGLSEKMLVEHIADAVRRCLSDDDASGMANPEAIMHFLKKENKNSITILVATTVAIMRPEQTFDLLRICNELGMRLRLLIDSATNEGPMMSAIYAVFAERTRIPGMEAEKIVNRLRDTKVLVCGLPKEY